VYIVTFFLKSCNGRVGLLLLFICITVYFICQYISDNMIQNLLSTCGLNETEKLIFLHLIERGQSIASIISKQTNLKRPTVYAILDNLLRIGIITKQRKDGVTYFSPISTEMIPRIFENKAKNSYEDIRTASSLLTRELQKIQKKEEQLGGFNFETIESVEAMYIQFKEVIYGGDFAGIFNPQLAVSDNRNQKLVSDWLKNNSVSKPKIREIAVAGPLTEWYKSHIDNPNHLLKEIPADSKIISDMILLNGSVFLFHYEKKKEIGIKIKHKDFYTSMMTIFEMLWKSL
jgi:sugar-specific transcriptional regulator TrmB